MRVAIVGAGLAGLAAAVAAGSAGTSVDLFDVRPRLAAPRAHIDIVPMSMRELVALGVGDACLKRGFAYRGISVVTANGGPAFDIPTPTLAGPRWPAAMGMVYGDLLQVLYDAAVERGARVRWSTEVDRLIDSSDSAELGTTQGGRWKGDLVLLAGTRGLRGVSARLAGSIESFPQRWDCALVPRPRGLDRSTWIVGPERAKALVVPVSVAQAGVAVLRVHEADASVTAMRDLLMLLDPVLRGAWAHVDASTSVVRRQVNSGLLAGPWHEGSALCIGDSAHVLPPHFGQAAAQSLEDATVLGDLLRLRLPREQLFDHFMRRRGARAERAHAVATQAARWDLNPEPATDLSALVRELAPIIEHGA